MDASSAPPAPARWTPGIVLGGLAVLGIALAPTVAVPSLVSSEGDGALADGVAVWASPPTGSSLDDHRSAGRPSAPGPEHRTGPFPCVGDLVVTVRLPGAAQPSSPARAR
jgi:hypothetical protein